MKYPYEFRKVDGLWQRRVIGYGKQSAGPWRKLRIEVKTIISKSRTVPPIHVKEWYWE